MKYISFLLLILIAFITFSFSSNNIIDKKNSEPYSFINDSSLLTLAGDFDGDGTKEILVEHYFSKALNKEVPVPHIEVESDDFDRIFDEVAELEPISFMTCSDHKIDTLHFQNTAPLFGIYYIKNEGDLDGDGGDEISFILSWMQYSTTTTCTIASYKNGKWIELYTFPTWSWAADEQMDKGGLIKKLDNNKIEVKYRTEDASQATKIVDLSKLPDNTSIETW